MEQCNSSEGKENQREGRSTYIGAAALYLSYDRQPEAEDGAPPNGKGELPQSQLHICRLLGQDQHRNLLRNDD